MVVSVRIRAGVSIGEVTTKSTTTEPIEMTAELRRKFTEMMAKAKASSMSLADARERIYYSLLEEFYTNYNEEEFRELCVQRNYLEQ